MVKKVERNVQKKETEVGREREKEKEERKHHKAKPSKKYFNYIYSKRRYQHNNFL